MKTKPSAMLILAIFIYIDVLTDEFNILTSAKNEETKDAYVISVEYSENIPAGKEDTWSITVHNLNCAANENGEAWFFFKFYIDGEPWWDEYKSTDYKMWRCDKGKTITNNYHINGWNIIEPVTREIKTELYWYDNDECHLKDAVSFNINITMCVSFSHIYAISYLTFYLMAFFALLLYNHLTALAPSSE
jgi:hypothetical protein